MFQTQMKRVYEPADGGDGVRVLVDRLWPRGLTKEKARVDVWLKDVAPSHALRKKVHADRALWDDFVRDYEQELQSPTAVVALAQLRELIAEGPVTLLFAAWDEERNNAVALARILARRG